MHIAKLGLHIIAEILAIEVTSSWFPNNRSDHGDGKEKSSRNGSEKAGRAKSCSNFFKFILGLTFADFELFFGNFFGTSSLLNFLLNLL